MKELYEQLGISSKVYDFGAEIEASLKERFEQFDKTAEYNQLKVLMAMQNVSSHHRATAMMILDEILWKKYMQILFIRRHV